MRAMVLGLLLMGQNPCVCAEPDALAVFLPEPGMAEYPLQRFPCAVQAYTPDERPPSAQAALPLCTADYPLHGRYADHAFAHLPHIPQGILRSAGNHLTDAQERQPIHCASGVETGFQLAIDGLTAFGDQPDSPAGDPQRAAISQSVGGQAPPISLDWLPLDDAVARDWDAHTDPQDKGIMRIQSTWHGSHAPRKALVVILPKRSESYQLAVNQFLRVLRRHEIAAHITLIHFNKQADRGMMAIDMAQRMGADLILSIGSETAEFLFRRLKNPSIPVVTTINKDPVLLGQVASYHQGSGNHFAFTSLNIPVALQVNYLRQLKPGLKVVGILYNRNHRQIVATEVNILKQHLAEQGIATVDIGVTSSTSAQQELRDYLPQAITQIKRIDHRTDHSILWVTSSTAIIDNLLTVNQLAGNIPVVGANPNMVNDRADSAMIAIGIDRRSNALLASNYVVKILKEKISPGELPVGLVIPPDIAINFRAVQRNGLKIPFSFFESASFIYDYAGRGVRLFGQDTHPTGTRHEDRHQ
jgi:putative ABC transport system substrate-binding protein